MADVRIRHDQHMVADAGNPSALLRTPANGDRLADDVVVAHLQACGFAPVRHILRVHAYDGKWIYLVVRAKLRRTLQYDMRDQFAVLAQLHSGPDSTIGSNYTRVRDLRRTMDNCRRVDGHSR